MSDIALVQENMPMKTQAHIVDYLHNLESTIARARDAGMCICVCMCVCVDECICVYMYICIYVNIYIYVRIHLREKGAISLV